MKKIVFLFALLLLVTWRILAAPAKPGAINYKLPDGSEITIELRGDEYANWAVTPDGYTMLFNTDGFLEYAVQDTDGSLKLSGIRAHNKPERKSNEQKFLQTKAKGLGFSSAQRAAMRQLRQTSNNVLKKSASSAPQPAASTVEGDVWIPVVLVGFQDKPFTLTQADFELLFNQLNYQVVLNGRTISGSLHDYYLAASHGKLKLKADFFGPYTLPNNIKYYDNKSGGGYPLHMVGQAADSAFVHGCDFSNYDADNDGIIDALHIIFAGYSQAVGAARGQSIWPHASTVEGTMYGTYTFNGKRLATYSCSEELYGLEGTNVSAVGTVAHELGHALIGFPDLYDADYNGIGREAVGLGSWCLMANGSYNGDQSSPALPSAWLRYFAGWTPVTDLPTAASDRIMPNPQLPEGNFFYRIPTTTPNEYFLLENRQQLGFDAALPGNGLLIYHVDGNRNDVGNVNDPGNYNCVNCELSRRGIYIKQAAGGLGSVGSDAGAPFPTKQNRSFTDVSVPNAKSWAGANSNLPINGIKRDTATKSVSFKVMGGTTLDAEINLLVMPYQHKSGKDSVRVRIGNLGLPVSSATIAWSINGVPQTPYLWTGNLAIDNEAVVALGTFDFVPDSTVTFSANITNINGTDFTSNVSTKSTEVTTPFFYEDFEGDISAWTFENGTQTNQWITGTATAATGYKSAYISNDGSSHQYTDVLSNPEPGAYIVYLYRDIMLPPALDEDIILYYDVMCMGKEGVMTDYGERLLDDYLRVHTLDTMTIHTPEAGIAEDYLIHGLRGAYTGIGDWQTVKVTIPRDYSGRMVRLTFTWTSEGLGGNQPPAAIDNIAIVSPKVGMGTKEDPIIITKAEELDFLARLMVYDSTISNDFGSNLGYVFTYSNWRHDVARASYKLGNDIDLSGFGKNYREGKGWIAIGGYDVAFSGNFNGDNHTISGLYVCDTAPLINNNGRIRGGLFGAVTGTVKNIILKDAVVICGENTSVGGIAQDIALSGNSTSAAIENCVVTGTISGSSYVGGIVGSVGNHIGNKDSVCIKNCAFIGTVEGMENINPAFTGIGGIAGNLTNATLCNSYSAGEVRGKVDNVGGLVGDLDYGKITNCYSTSNVNALGNYAGGIAGYARRSNTISCTYSTGEVIGGNYTGGIAGYTDTVKNNAALNPLVKATAGRLLYYGSRFYDAGRIASDNTSLSGNRAFNGMLDKDSSLNLWTAIAHDRKDGAEMTATNAKTAAFWTNPDNWQGAVWDANVWTIADNKLPILKNVGGEQNGEIPPHLQSDIVPVGELTLNKTSLTFLFYGTDHDTARLIATVLPENATIKQVRWETDHIAADVDSTGLVTVLAVGTSTITATAQGGITAQCVVTVEPGFSVSDVGLSRGSGAAFPEIYMGLNVGENEQLTATVYPDNASNKNVTWTSNDTSIATVTTTGLVTAKSGGTATITVTTQDGGFTAQCEVTVSGGTVDVPVSSVELNKSSLSMNIGENEQLTATVFPDNASNKNVAWTSSDTSIAAVTTTGLVTAKSGGTATITVTTQDGGFIAQCEVTVAGGTVNVPVVKVNDILKVYPSPVVNGVLTIDNGQLPIGEIRIYDLNGKLAYKQSSIVNRQLTINVSHLFSGTYVLKISNFSTKIVILN